MDRRFLPLFIVIAVVIAAVIVLGLVFRGVIQAGTKPRATAPVSVLADVRSNGDGILVTSTVTAVAGNLPTELTVIGSVLHPRLTTPDESRQLRTRSPISAVTVDGRSVQPGQRVRVDRREVTISYLVAPDEVGQQLVTVAAPFEEVLVRQLTATARGQVACLQPDVSRPNPGARAAGQTTWTRSCASPAVASADPAAPERDAELPVWVQFRF